MFEAYITNTALYPLMGIEVGTTVHFPMTTQELQAALAKIGIDGNGTAKCSLPALTVMCWGSTIISTNVRTSTS